MTLRKVWLRFNWYAPDGRLYDRKYSPFEFEFPEYLAILPSTAILDDLHTGKKVWEERNETDPTTRTNKPAQASGLLTEAELQERLEQAFAAGKEEGKEEAEDDTSAADELAALKKQLADANAKNAELEKAAANATVSDPQVEKPAATTTTTAAKK